MIPKKETKQQAILSLAYRNYGKRLNSYAFFRVSSKTVSEDLVQDAFKKSWIYLVRGGKINVMKSFLYHILKDLIVDEYRKSKSSSLDALIEKGFEPGEDNSQRLIDILDGKQANLLIAHLSWKYQRIIRMRYIEELSLQEMSLATGLSKRTLAVQVHRSLQKLRELYIK